MEEVPRMTSVRTLTLQYLHRYLQTMKYSVKQGVRYDNEMSHHSIFQAKNIKQNQVMRMHALQEIGTQHQAQLIGWKMNGVMEEGRE